MKSLYKFVMLLVFSLCITTASGQDVTETSRPDIPRDRCQIIEKILTMRSGRLNAEEFAKATQFLEESLATSKTAYERSAITSRLGYFYDEVKDYDKCFDLLKKAQKNGLFFMIRFGEHPYPEYIPNLQKKPGFDQWLEENKRMRDQAQQTAKVEYFVQTPNGYTKDKTYPLLIVFHGGVGSNIDSSFRWQSPRLKSEYIIAYMQGNHVRGSFKRSFIPEWQDGVKQAYQLIVKNYSVDTRRVLVGGQSAGGMMSTTIAQDQIIPVAGAILAFPVKPKELSEDKLKKAAESGLRIALLAGENDWAIKQQKEMGVIFDKAGLPNRFVVFPGTGHQFPEGFSNQIDVSLDYIWEDSEKESASNSQKDVTITYVGNEGFLVQSENKKVLIDALFKSNSASYLSPTDTMINQMIHGESPYDKVDLLFITHRHSDHFKPELTIAFLQNNQSCKLIANDQVADTLRNRQGYEQIESQIVEIDSDAESHSCFLANGIDVDAFYLKHSPYMRDGKNIHAEIKNTAFIVNLEGTRFYHSGDATIRDNLTILKDYEYSQKPVDIMFLQRYDTSAASKQFVVNTIKPDMIIAMHISPDEIDACTRKFVANYPHGIIFREQGQILQFINSANSHQFKTQDITNENASIGPENGSLVIMGGGGNDAIIRTFIELAGGNDAPIVVVPTAGGGDNYNETSGGATFIKNAGATSVTILHTNDPNIANSESFVEPLRNAKGVWFGGGRQWRLVDAYKNTLTEKMFWKVLERGGVIGGSSAGATIQGSYLARGDTKNNQIMMGDHEEGFGFLKNIAIDQHVFARNRQFDMFDILKHRPELLGIGIDEGTAILVRGNEFEVIGESYTIVYDGTFWSREGSDLKNLPEKNRLFYFLRNGDKYDLLHRKVIQ